MDAPLPSPSLNGPQNQRGYFTSASTSAQSSAPTSAAPQQQQISPTQQQQRTNETSPFLQDFNLVAEAAKRAQMAVLMRDFEGVGL